MSGSRRTRPLDDHYDEAFLNMERTVDEFAAMVRPPRLVQRGRLKAFRYLEQGVDQAIVQKLARLVSALRAARTLLDCGYVQEVGILKRVLDETIEDVHFLVTGVNDRADLHREFLEYFYLEEFDADTARASTQRRGMVNRQRIRAHFGQSISGASGSTLNPSDLTEDVRSVDVANSGYVHGASPQIMELYGGSPPRFHMNGMSGSPVARAHSEDFWSYVYRATCACALVAHAFGRTSDCAKIRAYADWFEASEPWAGAGLAGGREG